MRRLVLAIGLLLSAHAAEARTDTANDLLEVCEVWESKTRIDGTTIDMPSDPTDLAPTMECWGYMSAVMDFANVSSSGQRVLGICSPGHAQVTNYIRIFTGYARRHPTRLSENAALVAIFALREAFPC